VDDDGDAPPRLEALAAQGARATRDLNRVPTETYRCQATEALCASEPMSGFDVRQCVRELTSREVGAAALPARFRPAA
jgi:hypothetical protein